MKKLSTGKDSTLGNWLELIERFFGKESSQANFIKNKAIESKNGLDEEVITDEGQLLHVLMNME